MKKIIALLLCAVLVFCTACTAERPPEAETTTAPSEISVNGGTLSLAYSNADTLNPFTCKTAANLQILRLVYDGLFKIDASYKPIPNLAIDGNIEGKTVTVSLGAFQFSDGTSVTATDVKKSFEKAKASPFYAARLANFESAKAYEGNVIVFELTNADPYALSCLDFPVTKNGNDGDLTVGCGRYVPTVSGEDVTLNANTAKDGFNPILKTIKLLPVKDESAVISSLEVGNTCFHYNDLSGGVYSRLNANSVEMGINNFVYVAFNNESDIFSNKLVRQAVNLSVDRPEIVTHAFQGHAREAFSPFNPDWYMLASKDLIVAKNTQGAAELIAESGVDITAKEITFIINTENPFKLETGELITGYLEALGFKVNLKKMKSAEIVEALNSGDYDIYLGEAKLTPNMDLSPIFLGGIASFGINNISSTSKRYSQLLTGDCEIMDFLNTFNEDLPVIPLCYRNAAASYTNSIQASFACCDGDVFADIETWSFK